jgi:hypothetical protein
MSRGGSRFGAGRPGWKAKAEQCLPLDVRVMRRHGVLRNGYSGGWSWTWTGGERAGSIGFTVDGAMLRLSYSVSGDPRTQYVPIVRSPCNFGGSRPWFRCPVGGERVAVLYMRGGRFACRRCQRVAYLSQSEDTIGRTWRRQGKAEKRLGPNYERPKGMHRATHEALLSVIEACQIERDAALLDAMERMGFAL